MPRRHSASYPPAQGDFGALCPADDLWGPRKLEWQQDLLAAHPEVDVVFGAARRFGLARGDHVRPTRAGLLDTAWFAREMYRRNLIADPSAVVRRSLYLDLGGYEPLVGQDYEFWMRALAAGGGFCFGPRPGVGRGGHWGQLPSPGAGTLGAHPPDPP